MWTDFEKIRRDIWLFLVEHRVVVAIISVGVLLGVRIYSDSNKSFPERYRETLQDMAFSSSGNIVYDSVSEPKQTKESEPQLPKSPAKKVKQYIPSELPKEDDSWEEVAYYTGARPSCLNFAPKFDKSIDNKLMVSVGYNSDVVVKLMNASDKKCIRYVYIKAGDTYSIRNIPEGVYFLKIAYGKKWKQKIEGEQCVGKFTKNALYEKGDDLLDFNKVYKGKYAENGESYDSWDIPSFSLRLDVITTDKQNQFDSDEISESQFNQ